jgi:aspartate/methionine/tyrosine aminotransferase
MLAMQAIVNPGDEVVVVTPVWPNLTSQPVILGAQLKTVCLEPHQGRWTLPMEKLLQAVTSRTKLLVVNSPNNPTGWTLTRDEQQTLLAHCRRTGTWLLADEVYENLFYLPSDNRCAPSFLDISAPDDRLVVAHSFSKSFLMTGWRLGWLVMPPQMTEHMGKLIEFNTSCASVFVQRAGVAAMQRAGDTVPQVVVQMQACRDRLFAELGSIAGLELAVPDGGMYAFFSIPGLVDDVQTAKRLVVEAGLGLAPGSAFAPESEGWLRWCFASQDLSRLSRGVERLSDWLAKL